MTRTGKHALITGGGSGIGLAIARALAASGWQVTITGRNKNKLEQAAGTMTGAHFAAFDVTDAEAVRLAVRDLQETSGPVQLLVNNAGGVFSALFERTTAKAWRETIDLNLMGTVHCIQAVLPRMRETGWGRIVNIASTAGLTGYRYVSAYVAAKHAVVGLTKALALELAKTGITINAVCPGYTDTEVIASAVRLISKSSGRTESEALASFTATNPQGRLLRPEEIAAAVLWLASDDAGGVNGIALPIAGGEVT